MVANRVSFTTKKRLSQKDLLIRFLCYFCITKMGSFGEHDPVITFPFKLHTSAHLIWLLLVWQRLVFWLSQNLRHLSFIKCFKFKHISFKVTFINTWLYSHQKLSYKNRKTNKNLYSDFINRCWPPPPTDFYYKTCSNTAIAQSHFKANKLILIFQVHTLNKLMNINIQGKIF